MGETMRVEAPDLAVLRDGEPIDILESGGTAVAIAWPGMGAQYRALRPRVAIMAAQPELSRPPVRALPGPQMALRLAEVRGGNREDFLQRHSAQQAVDFCVIHDEHSSVGVELLGDFAKTDQDRELVEMSMLLYDGILARVKTVGR